MALSVSVQMLTDITNALCCHKSRQRGPLYHHIAERNLGGPELLPDSDEFTGTGTPCSNLFLPAINTLLRFMTLFSFQSCPMFQLLIWTFTDHPMPFPSDTPMSLGVSSTAFLFHI